MMEVVIAQKHSYKVELEAGTYWWCACGRSAKQPFCDGSHKGTGFSPTELVISEKKLYALCGCKHAPKAPFCDGTHRNLE
ncbi:MAG: CDGSH iron-sulfur domain-containing protein [Candidatus Kapabacteria bacterium]|nr:CDGSH iron-sulfur domain-containing protein [Ignavibacteriota bacterium]MCW5885232.1 CDGSH iron-sulfur domain-containing protein [Candidatus Kapabacteria bacterium]